MGFFHIVKSGEYLAKIARAHGIADWKALYEHPGNASFREARPNPNLIAPGDQVYIPAIVQAPHTCSLDARHTFELQIEPQSLQVQLRKTDGTPMARVECVLHMGEEAIPVTSDSNGIVRHDALPLELEYVELEIGEQRLKLAIGHLDPCETLSGVQGRLRNLGYYFGHAHGVLDDATQAAIDRFKGEHGLPEGPEITPEFTDALRQEYGF